MDGKHFVQLAQARLQKYGGKVDSPRFLSKDVRPERFAATTVGEARKTASVFRWRLGDTTASPSMEGSTSLGRMR